MKRFWNKSVGNKFSILVMAFVVAGSASHAQAGGFGGMSKGNGGGGFAQHQSGPSHNMSMQSKVSNRMQGNLVNLQGQNQAQNSQIQQFVKNNGAASNGFNSHANLHNLGNASQLGKHSNLINPANSSTLSNFAKNKGNQQFDSNKKPFHDYSPHQNKPYCGTYPYGTGWCGTYSYGGCWGFPFTTGCWSYPCGWNGPYTGCWGGGYNYGPYWGGYGNNGCNTTVIEVPVQTPVVPTTLPRAAATQAPVDLQLVSLQMLDAGDASADRGPAYRVTIRNNSPVPVEGFDVALAPTNGETPDAKSLVAVERIQSIAAQADRTLDLRLPGKAQQMHQANGGQIEPFTTLFAGIDPRGEVKEDNKENNVIRVARTEIPVAATTP